MIEKINKLIKRKHNKWIAVAIFGLFVMALLAFVVLCFDVHNDRQGNNSELTKSSDVKNEQKTEETLEGPNTEYVVYVETGHGKGDDGKWDTGCTWSDGETTYEEAKVMIPIAKAMVKYLRQSGVKVYTDADDDNNLNLNETLEFLDKHKVNAFINIHCDWEHAESGTMPLYKTDEQKKLAEAVNEGVHSVIDIPDRGLAVRDDLDTLNKSNCPAVLFETGSIKADNEILTTQYDEYGKGLAIGMCNYLGVDFNSNANSGQ